MCRYYYHGWQHTEELEVLEFSRSEGPHVIVDGYVGTSQDLMNELEPLTWTKQYSTLAD